MNVTWVSLLGWTLAIGGAAASIPQILHLARTRNVDGLSLTAELTWVLSWSLWLWCVTDLRLWPRIASEGLGLVTEVLIAALLLSSLRRVRAAGPALWSALPLLTVGLVTVLATRWLWGLDGMAIALTALDAVALAPLIRTTLRAQSLAGVSVGSWALKGVVYSGWIVYAIAIGHPLSAGWTFLMAPVAVFMLIRLGADRGLPARARRTVVGLRVRGAGMWQRMPVGRLLVGGD